MGATLGATELPPVGVAPMPLTDVEIKKAKYTREDGKPERITDGGGLYLELSASGGVGNIASVVKRNVIKPRGY